MAEVEAVVREHESAPERRVAQRALAREVTRLVHGERETVAAEQASAILFGGSVEDAGPDAFAALVGEVPTTTVAEADLADGIDILAVLLDVELASSRGDARRSIDQGAVQVNGERLSGERKLTRDDLRHGRFTLIRKGKRHFAVIVAGSG